MSESKGWNVIFLLDKNPPSKIVMLRRAPDKEFAPNFYTGIGGKVDPGETVDESAYRELKEETGLDKVKLIEFACCVLAHKYTLYYYWGIFSNQELPHTEDGSLEWVFIKDILNKDIIPTTQAVCQEWQKRDFAINKSFTLYLKEVGEDRGVSLVELVLVKEGLLF